MILILSNEKDESTNHVIRWLEHYEKKYIRINENAEIKLLKIDLPNVIIEVRHNNKCDVINFAKITSYWYRRGYFKQSLIEKISCQDAYLENEINKFVSEEMFSLNQFLTRFTKQIRNSIGHFSFNFTNKIENLFIANSVGLKTPKTLITNNKKDLSEWCEKNKLSKNKIVSKCINRAVNFKYNNKYARSFTSIISENDIKEMPNIFFPTLFQEKIEKIVDIRCFYLNGETYAMAIFSQNDIKTKIDFRNYNLSKPNRCNHFTLPSQIKKKIQCLMEVLGMNCGSLDIVLNKSKEYIFLEINPVGQFGMVSYPMNYMLEKLIAKSL